LTFEPWDLAFAISPFASKLGQNFLDEGTDLWEIIQKSIDTVPRFRGKTNSHKQERSD